MYIYHIYIINFVSCMNLHFKCFISFFILCSHLEKKKSPHFVRLVYFFVSVSELEHDHLQACNGIFCVVCAYNFQYDLTHLVAVWKTKMTNGASAWCAAVIVTVNPTFIYICNDFITVVCAGVHFFFLFPVFIWCHYRLCLFHFVTFGLWIWEQINETK